jgi:hypothetical protein
MTLPIEIPAATGLTIPTVQSEPDGRHRRNQVGERADRTATKGDIRIKVKGARSPMPLRSHRLRSASRPILDVHDRVVLGLLHFCALVTT